MNYGDDNIFGVSDNVPWYNHCSLTDALKDIGMRYTMADKESTSVPYIDIGVATFLKRTWRFEPCLNVYVCPLDISSIMRSLMVFVKSKVIDPKDQMASILISANDEFFWHGQDVFKEYQEILRDIIERLDLHSRLPRTLSSWSELCDRFIRASEKHLDYQSGRELDSVSVDSGSSTDEEVTLLLWGMCSRCLRHECVFKTRDDVRLCIYCHNCTATRRHTACEWCREVTCCFLCCECSWSVFPIYYFGSKVHLCLPCVDQYKWQLRSSGASSLDIEKVCEGRMSYSDL